MATTETPHSSWIDSISYISIPDSAETYLAVFTAAGPALLYRGVPSYLPGLLAAGTPMGQRHSTGRAYNKLVKGRYEYTRVEEPAKVAELKRLIGAELS